ncbi:MAG: hypothetical protein ACOVMP_00465 [Chthoniobacterales bacterium]
MIDDAKRRRAAIIEDESKGERVLFLFAEISRGIPRDPQFGAGSPDEEPFDLSDRHSPRTTENPTS